MSYPPFNNPGHYSPSRAYSETNPYSTTNTSTNIPPSRDFPPYPYPREAPQQQPPLPPSAYRSYEPYQNEPARSSFRYDNRDPYASDSYDPHQPANNYTQALNNLPSFSNAPRTEPIAKYVPPRLVGRPVSPSRQMPVIPVKAADTAELSLLTSPTTSDLPGLRIAIHALPPSHLPITKYVPVNGDDAIEIHRHLCRKNASIWYADGSSRAGEGWSAAVQWILDPGRSGSKMRGCVGDGDALDAELGGICKAVEGFLELLEQSIKTATPISHELIVFCDSQAAIVSIDTASRPESLRFDTLWRNICSEYLQAHLTLVWIPKNSNIEGHILADKIATVGASNSYLKKKKEGSLPEVYRRPGAGEPAAPASAEAGPWQRGDADPSRRKAVFDRPKPAPLSPPIVSEAPHDHTDLATVASNQVEGEEETVQPRADSIFVTQFPESITAKDLGILFAQFGNIVAVDIYHITPAHPRFAFVAYTAAESGLRAMEELNGKPINLDSPFARENSADLETWRQWPGRLRIAKAEPPRLVPSSVADLFPELPEWAGASLDRKADDADSLEVETQIKHEQERSATPPFGAKRDRSGSAASQSVASAFTSTSSKSPLKRARLERETTDEANLALRRNRENISAQTLDNKTQNSHSDKRPDPSSAPTSTPLMPPFPPTLNSEGSMLGISKESLSSAPVQTSDTVVLPPTPQTSASSQNLNEQQRSSDTFRSTSAKPTLTNSAAMPQEYPIKLSSKTLRSLLNLIRSVFVKHDATNWIAHSCLIAVDLDQARRALQADLYATDEAFLSGRDLERTLAAKGFTAARMDSFISKVLKVLDGIAMAEQGDIDDTGAANGENEAIALAQELNQTLESFPEQTREAVQSAGKLLEYLNRGKDAQEKKRLEVERRVKVLEGMVKVGEVVGGVVRYLLTENSA